MARSSGYWCGNTRPHQAGEGGDDQARRREVLLERLRAAAAEGDAEKLKGAGTADELRLFAESVGASTDGTKLELATAILEALAAE